MGDQRRKTGKPGRACLMALHISSRRRQRFSAEPPYSSVRLFVALDRKRLSVPPAPATSSTPSQPLFLSIVAALTAWAM